MSKIEELIQKLCPNSIDRKKLWEVTIWDKKFNSVNKIKQKRTNLYPYLLAKDLFSLEEKGDVFLLSTGERTGWTTEEQAGDYLCEGEVVTIPWGKSRSVGDVMKYYKGKFVTADNRIATSCDIHILSNKYLFYYLKSQSQKIDTFYRGAGIQHPNMASVLDMEIPIPPIEVQEEIVRILDTFTALSEKLNQELELRKKQYEHYKEKLLSFEGKNVEWKPLGLIASFNYGYTDKAKDEGSVRFIRITDILDSGHLSPKEIKYIEYTEKSEKYLVNKGDLLMARTGASFGKTLYYTSDEPAVYASFLIQITLNDKSLTNRYYWHFSKSKLYWTQANKLVSLGGQPQFNANALSNVKVPIPSLAEQERIVSILDKFDTLVNDQEKGLPAEIRKVQQQYEYYRDKLLTF